MAALYYPELLNFFAHSLSNRDAAQDVVQEAYARVLTIQQDGTAIHNLRAMLFRVGKNIVVDQHRRRESEAVMLRSLAVLQDHLAPSPDQQVHARQQIERFVSRLQAMPHKRRDAFVLVRIHGCSYTEAAQTLGIAADSVGKHLVRAVIDLARFGCEFWA